MPTLQVSLENLCYLCCFFCRQVVRRSVAFHMQPIDGVEQVVFSIVLLDFDAVFVLCVFGL